MADMKKILTEIEKLSDSVFLSLTSDPERMTAIREQMYSPIRSKNVRTDTGKMTKEEIEKTFNVSLVSAPDNRYEITDHNTDRQAVNVTLSYYKSRWDVTPEKNRGALKEALFCFGQGEMTTDENGRKKYDNGNADWMNRICENAGITSSIPSPTSDTAQSKAEKRKQATSQRPQVMPKIGAAKPQSQSQPAPDRADMTAPAEPITFEAPAIGTAFLASNMQFVLYKPSEAYQKPERQAIIKNYYYADTITMLYGQAGSYKTFYAIWEGLSLVLGNTLCGMEIEPETEPQKVLYISLEMSAKDISDRLMRMTKDLTETERKQVEDNFTIISAEDTANMKAGNDTFLSALGQLCTDKGYNVIYLDSFADYTAGKDLRSEGDMTSVIDALRTFTLKYHVSFRIIHHGTKPTQDANGSMAGIHTIRDLVDNVYLVKATDTKEVTVTSDMLKDRSAKSRHGEPVTLLLQFVSDAESFSFKRLRENKTTSHIEKVSRILSFIEEDQGITTKELRDRCGNPKDFTSILNSMIGTSIIVDTDSAKKGTPAKHYYTVDYWNNTHNSN